MSRGVARLILGCRKRNLCVRNTGGFRARQLLQETDVVSFLH